jgi:predicted RNA-binding protein YlqC (UPF0109 family)
MEQKMFSLVKIFNEFWPSRLDDKCISETAQVTVTRDELEDLFAYELRVANADVSKLKVYARRDRFKSAKIIPLDVAQHGPVHYDAAV